MRGQKAAAAAAYRRTQELETLLDLPHWTHPVMNLLKKPDFPEKDSHNCVTTFSVFCFLSVSEKCYLKLFTLSQISAIHPFKGVLLLGFFVLFCCFWFWFCLAFFPQRLRF